MANSADRSTKAGARTPATHLLGVGAMTNINVAQRRPGREPRRHTRERRAPSTASAPLNEGRGANPGDTRGSTRRRSSRGAALNEGRGANPGDTLCGRDSWSSRPRTLNEGRGANPGDTRWTGENRPGSNRRSTKAGARTPATLGQGPSIRRPLRSAQRRPGREPRRHREPCPGGRKRRARSTKAGARTPATRGARRDCPRTARPLNEGRGANPGDTRRAPRVSPVDTSAQRRPGREPRRHVAHALGEAQVIAAQRRPGREPRRHQRRRAEELKRVDRSTKAGARTPATPTSGGRWRSRPGRSTKAGARTPATLHWRFRDGPRTDPAQRRPGREPRRHWERGVAGRS